MNEINQNKIRIVLMTAMSTSFITSFAGSALTLSVPSMGSYFNLGATSVGWIITIYTIVVAAFSVPLGKIADSTSRKKMLVLGTSIFIITSFAAVFATAGWMIIAIRGIQSLGAAMIFATNMPIAIAATPPQKRGHTIGIVTSGVYVGLTLGPVLGGLFNSWFGWQSIFIFSGIVGTFALITTIKGVEDQQQKDAGFRDDFVGNVLYVLMICFIIYGLTSLTTAKFGWVSLVFGIGIGIVFVHVESKKDNPLMDIRLFKGNLTFSFSLLTAFFQYSSSFALSYLVSIYLQVVMGYSSKTAGLIMIVQPLLMAILSPRMGKLSDRISPYKLASAGILLCACTEFFFAIIHVETPLIAVLLALGIAGIGTALFSSPNTNVIMSCVPPSKFGVTNSILSATRTSGQSFAMAIITLVVSSTVGNVSLYSAGPDNLLKTMHIGFIIFTALCLIGCFMSLYRRKTEKE